MGVSGAGKTTLGLALAEALGWRFYEGDDFHPSANVAKMAAGIPLTDADRAPWLEALAALIGRTLAAGERMVLACSSLREQYREVLAAPAAAEPGALRFVYLKLASELARARVAGRAEHFMPPVLIESQYATLEEPSEALVLDARLPVQELVRETREAFRL
jgi:gluconokinase